MGFLRQGLADGFNRAHCLVDQGQGRSNGLGATGGQLGVVQQRSQGGLTGCAQAQQGGVFGTQYIGNLPGLLFCLLHVGGDAGEGLHHVRDRGFRLAARGSQMAQPYREQSRAQRNQGLR